MRPFLTLLRCALDVVAGAEQLDPGRRGRRAHLAGRRRRRRRAAPAAALAAAPRARRRRRAPQRRAARRGGAHPVPARPHRARRRHPRRRGPPGRSRRPSTPCATARGSRSCSGAMWSASGLAGPWRDTALGGGPGGGRADRDLDAVLGAVRRRRPLRRPAARRLARATSSTTCWARTSPATPSSPGRPAGESVALRDPRGIRRARVGPRRGRRGAGGRLARPAAARLAARVRPTSSTSSPAGAATRGRPGRRCGTTRPGSSTSRSPGPAERLVVTAVRSEDEQPSPFLDVVDPPAARRAPFTDVARPLTLPGLVAELRREVGGRRPGTCAGRRSLHLARLARARGCPGADPAQWWALRDVSDDRPLRAPGEPGVASRRRRSTTSAAAGCGGCCGAAGGDGPSMGAQDIGTLVHEIAARPRRHRRRRPTPPRSSARWGRLGLAAGLAQSRRDLGRAQAMTTRLARYVAEAGAAGWRRAGLRGAHPGRARAGRRAPARSTGSRSTPAARCGSSTSRPARASPPRRGAAGTASSAPTSSPSRRAPSPSTAAAPAGAALLQLGRAASGQDAPLQLQPPLDRRRRAGLGPRRSSTRSPTGMAGRGLRGHPRRAVRHLPGQGLLPRPARRGGGCDRRCTASGRWPDAAPRCAGARSSSPGARPAHAPTPEQAAVIEAPLRPLLVVAGRRVGQDRDDGRAGGLAGRQRPGATPTRCSASPSPARPPASCPSG